MVARREQSDFQVLAHFAQRWGADFAARLGGSAAELAVKGVGEVAMAGKAEIEGQRREIVRAFGQSFERGTETELGQVDETCRNATDFSYTHSSPVVSNKNRPREHHEGAG
jgi:hypothetical protein